MVSLIKVLSAPGHRASLLKALAAAVLLFGAGFHIVAGNAGSAVSSLHSMGNDDAYISFRYAKNLAEGHGLVFNPGERVEGYTNLLFVLMAALMLRLIEADAIYWAASAANLIFLATAFFFFHRHVHQQLDPGRAAAAALLFGLCPALWLWTASGMETIFVFTLQMVLWILVERRLAETSRWDFPALALVLNLAVLARADGFLLPFITVVFFAISCRWLLAFHTAAVTAPVIGGYFLWRLGYYGDLLPNTYYAKVDGPLHDRVWHAMVQLFELGWTQGLLPYLLALVTLAFLGLRARRQVPFVAFLPLCLLLYWLYVGGDHFGERFLLLVYPLGILTILKMTTRFPHRYVAVTVGLLLALQLHPLVTDLRFRYDLDRYDFAITLGESLGKNFPGSVLAVGAAGKIPYFSGLRTLDMRGLTDTHIAHLRTEDFKNPGHDKIDPDYVLARRPDLIAAWISPSFDLALGLDRKRYETAGYRLRFVVNATRKSQQPDIADVRGRPPEEVRQLIRGGYAFGVLERAETRNPVTQKSQALRSPLSKPSPKMTPGNFSGRA